MPVQASFRPVLTPAAAETSDGDAGVSAQRGGDPCPGCAEARICTPAPQGVDWYAVVRCPPLPGRRRSGLRRRGSIGMPPYPPSLPPSLPSLPSPMSAARELGGLRARRPPEGACIDHGGRQPAGPRGAPGNRGRISPPGMPGMAGCAPRTSSLRERPPPVQAQPARPAARRRPAQRTADHTESQAQGAHDAHAAGPRRIRPIAPGACRGGRVSWRPRRAQAPRAAIGSPY